MTASEIPGETPLEHHRRHPRSFLDLEDLPDAAAPSYRFWCLECNQELPLSEVEAERWASLGVPWRTGTE